MDSFRPLVRFAGFEGEWERVRLGEIAQFFKGKGYSKNDLTEKGSPIFLYGMMYTKYRFAVNEVDTYTDKDFSSLLSQGNEVIIPASGETAEDIACASAFLIKDVILGGDLNVICFDLSLYSTPFIALSISNGSSRKYLSKCAQGKSVVHLRNSDIKTVVLSLPSLPEQQKISEYFTEIDRAISLQTEKLSKLKQIKAASLQNMFPQEGQMLPKVRFAGFEGEWEKVKLGDCLEISTEKNEDNTYGINEVLSVSDEEGVVNQIQLLGRSYAGKSVSSYKVLKTNQIVYTKSPLKAKPFGIIKVNKGDIGIVSVLYAVFDAKKGVFPDFIHYYFEPPFRINNYLHPLIKRGAKNTMNISDIDSLQGEIAIPCSIEEQQAIANYFTKLDRKIELETQKLEKLKQIKSACLSKMFV